MAKTLLGSQFLLICLYISLALCAAGIAFRFTSWFLRNTGPESERIPVWKRFLNVSRSIIKTFFSIRFFFIIKGLLLDVILQVRILKTSVMRWVMHILIFTGFMGLLLMHALDELVTEKLTSGYYSTINPYQFLRNVFGIMVVAGIGIAVFRRILNRSRVLKTRLQDILAITAVAVIIISGFLLEGAKIISEPVFDRMVTDFMSPEDPAEAIPLKVYWRSEYSTVFKNLQQKATPEMLEEGKTLNEDYCSGCHSPMQSAFISFPLAKGMALVGNSLNRSGADIWLYYIHVFACFIALALLPFTKFFHIITNPLIMIIGSASDKRSGNTASALPRRALELDSCTNCGTCSTYCSVLPVYTVLGNEDILPAHKISTMGRLGSGKIKETDVLASISEGAFACTSCFKCTEVCPAGINLQDQWRAQKKQMEESGCPSPHIWIKEHSAAEWSDRLKVDRSVDVLRQDADLKYYELSGNSDIFAPCIQCQTCTNVCPVVAANPDPSNAVDITPQKIMNLLRLGLRNLAQGTRMVWDCTTCFQCQENCPQGIKVTEIIYELKNISYGHFKNIDWPAETDGTEKD